MRCKFDLQNDGQLQVFVLQRSQLRVIAEFWGTEKGLGLGIDATPCEEVH